MAFPLQTDILFSLFPFLSRQSLVPLSLTCHAAREVFQPALWRRVTVRDAKDAAGLLKVDRPELWNSVRVLWILPYSLAAKGESGDDNQGTSFDGAGGPECAWELVAASLAAKCPRLRILNVSIDEPPSGRRNVAGRLEVRMSEVSLSSIALANILDPLRERIRWLYLLSVLIVDSEPDPESPTTATSSNLSFSIPNLSLLALTLPKPPRPSPRPSEHATDPATTATMLEVLRENAGTLNDLMLYAVSSNPDALKPFAELAVQIGLGSRLGFLGVLGSGAGGLIKACTVRHFQVQLCRLSADDRTALEQMKTLEFLRVEDDFVHLSHSLNGAEGAGLATLRKTIASNRGLEVLGINRKPFTLDANMDSKARDTVYAMMREEGFTPLPYADPGLVIFAKGSSLAL